MICVAIKRQMLHDPRQEFERALEPHLRAAYNLARWLVGNHHDAEDVTQESLIKAFRAVDRVRLDDARAWLLAIVRNTALNHIHRRRPKAETEWSDNMPEPVDQSAGPESALLLDERRGRVHAAIERLPLELRETLVLREVEGLTYKEIAWVLKIPIGTVMSRLSRGRAALMQELIPKEKSSDVYGS